MHPVDQQHMKEANEILERLRADFRPRGYDVLPPLPGSEEYRLVRLENSWNHSPDDVLSNEERDD